MAPGHSRTENGVDTEGVSVIKNWRHSVGPSQLSSGHDDAVRHARPDLLTHTRKHITCPRVCRPLVSEKLEAGRSREGESLLDK